MNTTPQGAHSADPVQKLPESVVEFARKVAALAAEYKLNSLGMTFTPSYSVCR